jgi:hypothetical protein
LSGKVPQAVREAAGEAATAAADDDHVEELLLE